MVKGIFMTEEELMEIRNILYNIEGQINRAIYLYEYEDMVECLNRATKYVKEISEKIE